MTTATKKLKVIPKNTFDALEMSVLVNGGGKIGEGRCSQALFDAKTGQYAEDKDTGELVSIPVCLMGHINFLAGERLNDYNPKSPLAHTIIKHVGGTITDYGDGESTVDRIVGQNDRAIQGAGKTELTWKQYVKARGWVRGE